ncbi:MAG: hypothetical protein K0R14_64 [Burkholderiales bacterium]|jgi:hypothetical protein|nr:hypothetical protein [Burkholderiales bacterium]
MLFKKLIFLGFVFFCFLTGANADTWSLKDIHIMANHENNHFADLYKDGTLDNRAVHIEASVDRCADSKKLKSDTKTYFYYADNTELPESCKITVNIVNNSPFLECTRGGCILLNEIKK